MTINTFRSSVRPVLTYLFACALILFVAFGIDPPEPFKTIAVSVIMFWFGQRTEEKRRNDP